MSERAVCCTIASNNYLGHARALARSFLRHHPGGEVHLLLVDRDLPPGDQGELPLRVTRSEGLGVQGFANMAFRYDVLELNTALKPYFLRYLNRALGIGRILYFDPDILVTAPLDELYDRLDDASLLLTPHVLAPTGKGAAPSELDILRCGTYNLGFLGIRFDEEASQLVDWWCDKLRHDCLHDVQRGLFVDQKWMDLAPSFCRRADVLRDPGCNVAYWNLPQRWLARRGNRWFVGDSPLRFFHFSGIDLDDLEPISKYQDRLTLSRRPDLRPLFEEYAAGVCAEGHEVYRPLPYGFGRFADDTPIPRVARRSLQREDPDGTRWPDPFAVGPGTFREWLTKGGPAPESLPPLARALWELRDDVQAAFPHPEGDQRSGFVRWLLNEGAEAAAIEGPLLAELRTALEKAVPTPEGIARPQGVNVVGYHFAESGIGEHTRLVIEALAAAGEDYSAVAYSRSPNRQEHPFSGFGHAGAIFDVNLVGINADMLPACVDDVGEAFFRDRYTIGIWAWEVDQFPAEMARAARFVDEIWAISAFCASTIAPAVDCPVVAVPLPIRAPEAEPLDRGALGLPESFLVSFVFDFNSVFERKNPLAVVDAFRRAFGEGEATLALKAVNGEHHPVERRRLLDSIAGHPDISLLEGYWSPQRRAALIATSDVYLSLHRAEGFGLTMAEAMALGRPVIATGYSGNLDFMTPDNSFLVPWRRVPVPAASGPYPPGSRWADPDVEAAAQLLRTVRDQPELAARRAARGLADIERFHSPIVRGAFMREHLERGRERRRDAIVLAGSYPDLAIPDLRQALARAGNGSGQPLLRRVLPRIATKRVADLEPILDRLLDLLQAELLERRAGDLALLRRHGRIEMGIDQHQDRLAELEAAVAELREELAGRDQEEPVARSTSRPRPR